MSVPIELWLKDLQPDADIKIVASELGINLYVINRWDTDDDEVGCGVHLNPALAARLVMMLRLAIAHTTEEGL